jgi:hypothetical protein
MIGAEFAPQAREPSFAWPESLPENTCRLVRIFDFPDDPVESWRNPR